MSEQLIMTARILLAAVLGGIIGWQREKAHKPAGLRTHVLIATGAALFTVISINLTGGDSLRIAAGIVTGIGFLGAGAILHRAGIVEGLTTAASIWVVAAIGMGAGAGFYIVSVIATLLVFIILLLPHHESEKTGKDEE